jgi:hypothetical protein
MQPPPSKITEGHPDFAVLEKIREEILSRAGGQETLITKFPILVQDAVEFVLDPIRTGRTRIADLDNVEKTFIGLKVEHFFRDFLDVPKGIRDLVIAGSDVDVKNTVRDTWMIPREIYKVEGACVLIACDEPARRCWLGIVLARNDYLNAPNQDKKRSIARPAFSNILWLVEGAQFPESHWLNFDMGRFRQLRKMNGGSKRAAQFFRENLNKRVHRTVIQSLLFDQKDPMKRLRNNGGVRDILRNEKIALLSGIYDSETLRALGFPDIQSDQVVALSPRNLSEETLLRGEGHIA